MVLASGARDTPGFTDTSVSADNLVSTPLKNWKMVAEAHEADTSLSVTKPEPTGKTGTFCRLASPSADGLAGGAETLRMKKLLPGVGVPVATGGAVVEACVTPAVVR